ncbi:MAG TPA: glycoside hydrolase domain-containing protein [Phycisphaerae bacterium]|nr:glycoside hydrolase domain-containing protein [Phycisphaerae bacterium]
MRNCNAIGWAGMLLWITHQAAVGETVVLQQGVDGYADCTARTIVDGSPDKEAPGAIFKLRGASNDFHLKFVLPETLSDKRLARARLAVFLPEARNANLFTEIFCHEVVSGGRQPATDTVTDYDNGGRPGAVDSVELFAPAGPGWQHQPFLPIDVPTDGKWIEFNVTPLAEKWLADPRTNHGVLLVPTDSPRHDMPSTWQIDVPSVDYDKPDLRPRLTLEVAPLAPKVLVGMTDSLRRICDRSTRYGYRGGYDTRYAMSMAANEYEAFQVVVYPLLADLLGARFTWTDLVSETGETIPADQIECFVEDWYPLRGNWKTRSLLYAGKLYETVDPLIPAAPVAVRRQVHTPFYFRVRTETDTASGTYHGTITLRSDNVEPVKLSLAVNVWPYAIPQRWNFHTMGQLIWGNLRRFHGDDFDDELAKRYYDFLLEHRFSPTEQYGRILSPRTLMPYCLQNGMNTVYLSGNFTGTEEEMARLQQDYQTVKRFGALDYALVYIGDETSKWDEMRRRADLVHARLPGVQVMIGGSFPRDELMRYIDVYDPQIGGKSKVYSLQEDSVSLIAESQQRGEEFYWYVAAGPAYPYPNVQVEDPLIASRVLFWMTWKYGVTGFEYYCYNIWERNYAEEPALRYPRVPWQADGWSRGWPSNGDGMLFYPGPISSLRFEAIRDGLEDWESHLVLRDMTEALRTRKRADRHASLIARAEKLLAMDPAIVSGFDRYTLGPARLLAEREKLGALIASLAPIVSQTEKWDAGAYTYARAAEVRIAKQTALRRAMLYQRHVAARKALSVEWVSPEAWAELWPQRVLFSQDFEGAGDWDGQLELDNVPAGSKRAVAGHAANKYFARHLRVGIRYDHARAATTTWIRFQYFLSKPARFEIKLFDLTQEDNYGYWMEEPVVGQWAEAELKVTGLFKRKDGSDGVMAAGDAIDDIFFGAGSPGDKDLSMLIDDVVVLGRD